MSRRKQLSKSEVITSLLNAISYGQYVGIYTTFKKGRELYDGRNLFFISYLAQRDVKYLGEAKSLTRWDIEGFSKECKIYHFQSAGGVITELAIEKKYTENI